MSEDQKGRTTMAVLKAMGAVNPDGSSKVAPAAPTIPVAPFAAVDEELTLSKVYERIQFIKPGVMTWTEIQELTERVKAGPGKIEKAAAAGATVQQIQAATLKVAELDDKLAEALTSAARLYLLTTAYNIARDFRVKAGNGLASALAEAGGTITVDVPGIITFKITLAGPDDEPPF